MKIQFLCSVNLEDGTKKRENYLKDDDSHTSWTLYCFLPCKKVDILMSLLPEEILNFIYSEKATKFCEISTLFLTSVLHTVKSKVDILQNFAAFSKYMNFKSKILPNFKNYIHRKFPYFVLLSWLKSIVINSWSVFEVLS